MNLNWWQWLMLGVFVGCCVPSVYRFARGWFQNWLGEALTEQLFGPYKK